MTRTGPSSYSSRSGRDMAETPPGATVSAGQGPVTWATYFGRLTGTTTCAPEESTT